MPAKDIVCAFLTFWIIAAYLAAGSKIPVLDQVNMQNIKDGGVFVLLSSFYLFILFIIVYLGCLALSFISVISGALYEL